MKDTRVAVLAAIFCGGFIAGTLDIGAASLINWLSPVIILHAIASGLLGKASFHDGAPAALLGLGLQWAMSLVIAAVYVLGVLRLSALTHHWMAGGVVYGCVIFLVMNYVVVPLSAAPFSPHFHILKILENLAAMIIFGVIVAFCARHFHLSATAGAQMQVTKDNET